MLSQYQLLNAENPLIKEYITYLQRLPAFLLTWLCRIIACLYLGSTIELAIMHNAFSSAFISCLILELYLILFDFILSCLGAIS